MNTLFSRFAPIAIVLAASLGSAAAHAEDSGSSAGSAVVAQASVSTGQQAQGAATQPAQHALTRRDVYDQLIQAEKDGTIKRLNDTVYFGS